MRLLMITALAGLPLLGIPAHADNNDFLGQAQRLLNNGNNNGNNDQESAYERGRRDEQRNRQAERDRRSNDGYRDDRRGVNDPYYYDDRHR